jgi:hypothetical protein
MDFFVPSCLRAFVVAFISGQSMDFFVPSWLRVFVVAFISGVFLVAFISGKPVGQ